MIIGITGLKGSGKSTVADYLAKKHGFNRNNFKDELVAELKNKMPDVLTTMCALFNSMTISETDVWDVPRLFREKPPLMRALMQNYGTEVRRHDNENYWSDQWKENLNLFIGDIVTDDVRFLNEAEAVRDSGGIIIRLVIDGETSNDKHPSEQEQAGISPDYTIIVERGQHEMLYDMIDEIVNEQKENKAEVKNAYGESEGETLEDTEAGNSN
jgi:hypothetical protein